MRKLSVIPPLGKEIRGGGVWRSGCWAVGMLGLMVQPLAQFDGTLISSHGAVVWAHPGAAPLLGPELEHRRAVVELVGRAADRAAAGAFTAWPIERATLLFGSGAMPGVVPVPGDLDLVVRIRHRPAERASDPAQAQERIAPCFAAFLRSFCLALGDEGGRFLRLATIWDGPFAGASKVPANSTVSWSLAAVACGRTLGAVGSVSLAQAAFECSVVKVALLLYVRGRLMPVEIAIESSFVCPGGVCDVSAAFTAFWFGKVAFTEAEARIAAGHEKELATLFPDRYRPRDFAWEAILRCAADMLHRREFRKIIGVSALLHAITGDGAALEHTRLAAACPGAQLAGLGARLSTLVKHSWARELDESDASVMLADLAADICSAAGIPGHGRWVDAISRLAGQCRLGPEGWAGADRLSEAMHETGLRHLAAELRSRPQALAWHDQTAAAQAIGAIPPPAAD